MRPALLSGLTVAGLLTSCSSAGPPKSQAQPTASPLPSLACASSMRAAFVRGGATGAVTAQADVTEGFSTCSYRTVAAKADACSAATVTLSTNPQPFKDFQRWVDESGQNAAVGPGEDLAPIAIFGIGIEADWIPGTLTFGTANNDRWVTVRLTCPDSGPQSLALAEALARAGLAAPPTAR